MRIQGIIHQNIVQLKWHILACFGLVMLLPIEELIVGFKDGYGFDNGASVIVAFMLAPLLGGLIACANVQADLNDRRYIFWRSKPVSIKWMIILKYIIGVVISVFIFVCPVIFGIIATALYNEKVSDDMLKIYIPLCLLLMILIYSLCFLSNVVVRSTARAWLIGILLTGFLLILPFLLPLNYRDISDVYDKFVSICIVFMLILSLVALVLSLFAAQHDWHLKTKLKSLLWVIAGIVFVLFMFFSSQVANIKVLDEKQLEYYLSYELNYVDDKIILDNRFIDINNNKISFGDAVGGLNFIPVASLEGYYEDNYPERGKILHESNGKLYSFNITTYYRLVGEELHKHRNYDKVYLRSFLLTESGWENVSELDISDCLSDNVYPRTAMRIIGNNLFAFVGESMAEVDVTDPHNPKIIHSKLNVLNNIRNYRWNYINPDFVIPIVPAEGIDLEAKIKLSIDLYYSPFYPFNKMYKYSIVDVWNKAIYFYLYSYGHILRYEVTRWDADNIYCQLKTTRPLTIVEGNFNELNFHDSFVKGGKLYCPGNDTLMVFDIRIDNRIRKLGHFVRINYEISDIAVAENGDILLCTSLWKELNGVDDYLHKKYLCLLEAP